MIGVPDNPSPSSAARIAPTRPSIMSEGATISAPATACDSAVSAKSSIERSLSTSPSRSTPQCPWVVYWQRQTSVITTISGTTALIERIAVCTTPPWS